MPLLISTMWLGWDLKTVWSFPQNILFFSHLWLLLSPSLWREIFLCWICASGKPTNFCGVSHSSEISAGEKESCVSHMKIWGCCERKLEVAAFWSKGRQFCRCLGLEVPSVGFYWKNTPELHEFRCLWNNLISCVLWTMWAPHKEPHHSTKCAPSPSTWKFWVLSKTSSPILIIYY